MAEPVKIEVEVGEGRQTVEVGGSKWYIDIRPERTQGAEDLSLGEFLMDVYDRIMLARADVLTLHQNDYKTRYSEIIELLDQTAHKVKVLAKNG